MSDRCRTANVRQRRQVHAVNLYLNCSCVMCGAVLKTGSPRLDRRGSIEASTRRSSAASRSGVLHDLIVVAPLTRAKSPYLYPYLKTRDGGCSVHEPIVMARRGRKTRRLRQGVTPMRVMATEPSPFRRGKVRRSKRSLAMIHPGPESIPMTNPEVSPRWNPG
jgi:hypothetical protein